MIITKGYGWEGMSEDSTGVSFEVIDRVSINMLLTEEDHEIEVITDEDNINVTLDVINIDIDIGD